MTGALLVLLALLGFANGAIDNSEGIATLVGYGAAKPRQALRWATLTSALGSLFSFTPSPEKSAWYPGPLDYNSRGGRSGLLTHIAAFNVSSCVPMKS